MGTHEISREEFHKILAEKDAIIEKQQQQIDWLMSQFKLLKQKQYGSSSETIDSDQLYLFNEAESSADFSKPEPKLTEVKAHYRKRTRLTTDKLPDDLPVEIIEHSLPEEDVHCKSCGHELHVMGKEIRDELKIIPARVVIKRHVQNVYSCRNCEKTSDRVAIVKADMPEPVMKGSFASPESLAHIAVQKYTMALPLYRQEQEWKQRGILLSRQTMSNWLLKAGEDWLIPICEEMKKQLLSNNVLHADETTVQVLNEPGKKAQQKSYMWLYRTSGDAKKHIILYEYQKDRGHARPKDFLKDFKGYLHTDGYSGYHKLPDDIVIVGCLSHIRRKFFEAYKTLDKDKRDDSPSAKGVAYCDALFGLEREFAHLAPKERFKRRDKESKPLLEEFYQWIDSTYALPKSLLGTAIGYAKSQKKYIYNYLLDGRLEISNNRAERSIKPFVIGRKNWMFSVSQAGARTSAMYYSLLISARENGLNPYEYLVYVFSQAPNLGKAGYAASFSDLLPTSDKLPAELYVPKPEKQEQGIYPWEEE